MVVLDFVGTDATIGSAGSRARTARSRWSACRRHSPVPVRRAALRLCDHRPLLGQRSGVMEVLALAREGKIRSRIRRFPLSQAPDAYAQFREGKIDGRAVMAPEEP